MLRPLTLLLPVWILAGCGLPQGHPTEVRGPLASMSSPRDASHPDLYDRTCAVIYQAPSYESYVNVGVVEAQFLYRIATVIFQKPISPRQFIFLKVDRSQKMPKILTIDLAEYDSSIGEMKTGSKKRVYDIELGKGWLIRSSDPRAAQLKHDLPLLATAYGEPDYRDWFHRCEQLLSKLSD